ncbi:Uncharacterised protein [Staphylococcus agnetis]|uniref:hypothetical protein n=1 Tax=Staphylococcus agnetis TaxID=985762 RepID=UPI000DFE4BE7|nr:hypothetical protein [Staphylococcus agnetis]SUK17545.1 Uncharacterised protein [Staphylococcus agnetis]
MNQNDVETTHHEDDRLRAKEREQQWAEYQEFQNQQHRGNNKKIIWIATSCLIIFIILCVLLVVLF